LKLEYGRFKAFKVWEVIWSEDLTLENGEEDLNLVEPTGVNRSMDLYGVGVPLGQSTDGGFPLMRGPIVGNPEDSLCRAIGLLLHDQIYKLVVGFYSRFRLADTEELGSVNIPSAKICQRAFSLIFKLHTPWLMRPRTDTDEPSMSGLDTGLFVRTDHVVTWPERNTVKDSEIEVQDTSGLFGEERVSWEEPTPMCPWPYRVLVEIAPNSGYADGYHNAAQYSLSGNVGRTETRKGETQSAGEFTSEGLDSRNNLRGKNSAACRTWVAPPSHRDVRRKTACATW
jgi:hypothetical protein